MAYMHDKQELKPGLIIFRRSDVKHSKWYCRIKIPEVDRYKIVSLKTTDVDHARTKAFHEDMELTFKVKHEMPIFDKPFNQVAAEYLDLQKRRADAGEITIKRWRNEAGYVRTQLNPYCGNVQVTQVGERLWKEYPLWRRSHGEGRAMDKRVSDETIRGEMKTFRAIMLFGASKQYTTLEKIRGFTMRQLKLSKPRGEHFTLDEYRQLHTHAREWVKGGKNKKKENKQARWYRAMFQNFMLFMANTGLRKPEARNLRWRDIGRIMTAKDGRPFLPISVRGKGKFRTLVAAATVGTYVERVRKLSKATEPNDFVFTTFEGKRSSTLYESLLLDILSEKETNLLLSAAGKRRNTTSFRHTYATFRLMFDTDPLTLAGQMGTSVKMIEEHYSHVQAVKNPDLILKGLPGWEMMDGLGEIASGVNADAAEAKAKPGKAKRQALPTAGKASRSTRRR